MALEIYDRVKETTTTTGTGTITLAGAVTGYRTFGSVLADSDTTYYAIDGGSEWEVGLGTIGGSGTTLARTTPLASSNAGAAVNFSAGTKTVFGTLPATLFSTAVATFLATPSSANLRSLLTDESGTGVAYFQGGALGTPASGTLSSCSGLPISTGVSGLGTGVATFLATPSSANLRAALTDESGTGAALFAGGALGTPASGTLSSCTGLPLTTGVTGTLGVTNGGTGTATQFTTGSIPFAGASGVYTQDNSSLFWDNTNKRLGIGTAAPGFDLVVFKDQNAATAFQVFNPNSGAGALAAFQLAAGVSGGINHQVHGTGNYYHITQLGDVDTFFADFTNFNFRSGSGTNFATLTAAGLRVGSTGSATSTLTVEGAVSTPITTVTGNTTLDATHSTVINNRGASNTLTLPAASSCVGRKYHIVTIQAQTVVSASSNVVPRTGGSAGTAILPATDGAWAIIQSDGSNWIIIASGT